MKVEVKISIAVTIFTVSLVIAGIACDQWFAEGTCDNPIIPNSILAFILAAAFWIITNYPNYKNRKYTRREIAKTYRNCVVILDRAVNTDGSSLDYISTMKEVLHECNKIVERANFNSHLLDSDEMDGFFERYNLVDDAIDRYNKYNEQVSLETFYDSFKTIYSEYSARYNL